MGVLHWFSPCYLIGKHLGHYETIEPQIPVELQYLPQLNPREPLWIFPLKSAREIVQLLKKSINEPSGSQESKLVLNKTITHISESEYMLYMFHIAKKLRKEAISNRFRIWAANKQTVVCKILDPSIGSQMLTKCECFCLIREMTQVGFFLHLMH